MVKNKDLVRVFDIRRENVKNTVNELRTSDISSLKIEKTVKKIIKDVKNLGDNSLIKYTRKFDSPNLSKDTLKVSPDEFMDAHNNISKKQLSALKFAISRLTKFEKRVLKKLENLKIEDSGIKVIRRHIPLNSVGCYVPGGKAVYPSSLLMTVIPAKVAGVKRIAVTSPPSKDGSIAPLVLVAADLCGIKEFYKIGGAQAIAALAYGTDIIQPVEKIIGPGNEYVTEAKLAVSKNVSIDLPAGPSELLILADSSAKESYVVKDMISQAEHGYDSIGGLITNSPILTTKVQHLLENYLERVERKDIVKKSITEKGFIVLCKDLNQMIAFANLYAAEHLEIMVKNVNKTLKKITSAGLILLGSYSPSAASDYCVGTNHVLPTGGYARTESGLSAIDFVKRIDTIECTKQGLNKIRVYAATLASSEGLENHVSAMNERFGN
jgi:histidinol dehydrogenase